MAAERARHSLLRTEQLRFVERSAVGIDLTLNAGDRVGIWGGAGSGKTGLLRALARLDPAVSGQLFWENVNVTRRPRWLLGRQRSFAALLLTNPYTALEPWAPVSKFLSRGAVDELLQSGALPPIVADYRVRSLSGMERVRLSLICALAGDPHVLLVDDVFRAVVPEVWPQLLDEMDQALGPEHALALASRAWQALQKTDYVFVLHEGTVVEWGPTPAVFSRPRHSYTQWLREVDVTRRAFGSSIPAHIAHRERVPEPIEVSPGHWARCLR